MNTVFSTWFSIRRTSFRASPFFSERYPNHGNPVSVSAILGGAYFILSLAPARPPSPDAPLALRFPTFQWALPLVLELLRCSNCVPLLAEDVLDHGHRR